MSIMRSWSCYTFPRRGVESKKQSSLVFKKRKGASGTGSPGAGSWEAKDLLNAQDNTIDLKEATRV